MEKKNKKRIDRLYDGLKLNKNKKIKISQISLIARHIELNIKVWTFADNNNKNLKLIYPGDNKLSSTKTIDLLFYRDHCAWIHKIKKLNQQHICGKCNQQFKNIVDLTRHTCSGGNTIINATGEKIKIKLSQSQKAFGMGDYGYSDVATRWIDNLNYLSMEGHKIHHKTCGHRGERIVCGRPVDGYNPETKEVYLYNGCYYHMHECKKWSKHYDGGIRQKKFEAYVQKLKDNGYKVTVAWECDFINPQVDEEGLIPIEHSEILKESYVEHPMVIPKPCHIMFDMEAQHRPYVDDRGLKLKILSHQKPVSYSVAAKIPGDVTIDGFDKIGNYLKKHYSCNDPDNLVCELIKDFCRLREQIVLYLNKKYRYVTKDTLEYEHISEDTLKELDNWINCIPIWGFNSGGYDFNLILDLFVDKIIRASGCKILDDVAKKVNKYMYIFTDEFAFKDLTNFCPAGMSLDSFIKSNDVKMTKLVYPHEHFTSFDQLEKATEILPRECFYSQLRGGDISQEDYDNLYVKKWKEYGCKKPSRLAKTLQ